MEKQKKHNWFISHASGGLKHTPTFFTAVQQFATEQPDIELVLPHELTEEIHKTKADIESADLVIAEVSVASTGSGIELGWANAAGKEIVVFHQTADDPSPAIQFVAREFHAYITAEHVVAALRKLAEQSL